MKKIDVSEWKEFHLYDIFNIDMGNKFDRSKMLEGELINFIGRTGNNNGINAVCGYYNNIEPYPSGLLTLALGGTVGACFVQDKQFYTSQNVVVLKPKFDMAESVKHFIACIIYNEAQIKYTAFSNEMNKHIKTDFTFHLPVTPLGCPDWDYMENYLSEILEKQDAYAEHLVQIWDATENGNRGCKVDTGNWKEFRVGDLFEVTNGTPYHAQKIELSHFKEIGMIPYVTRSANDNAVTGYVDNSKKVYIEQPKKTIAFGAETAYFTYQKEPYLVGNKMYYLDIANSNIKNKMNVIGLFLVATLNSQLHNKYGYNNGLTGTVCKEEKIQLPATPLGCPDWNYMEQYMKNIMEKEEMFAEMLVDMEDV